MIFRNKAYINIMYLENNYNHKHIYSRCCCYPEVLIFKLKLDLRNKMFVAKISHRYVPL